MVFGKFGKDAKGCLPNFAKQWMTHARVSSDTFLCVSGRNSPYID